MVEKKIKDSPQILMQLAKRGDRKAFARIYQLYFTPIFRYIYYRIRDKEETEDLVQLVKIIKEMRKMIKAKKEAASKATTTPEK